MPKLYFYYSAMNAGKSTTLLQSAFNYEERGMSVCVYLPEIVNKTHIESRIGLKREAIVFSPEYDFTKVEGDVDCILVDEAQFLTERQVWSLCDVVDMHSIPVLCYGLRTDFQGKLFTGSRALLGLADELVEIKTICYCGRKATMNVRVDKDKNTLREGNQVDIGGNDKYISVCRSCFHEN